MRNRWRVVGLLLVVAVVAVVPLAPPLAEGRGAGDGAAEAPVKRALEGLPLAFEENQGQTDPEVRFLARGRDATLFLAGTEAVTRVGKGGGVLRVRPLSANPAPKAEGLERLSGHVNYYSGTDPARWRTGIPTFAKVAYRAVYPGIDVIYYGKGGSVEYDFVVAPGADPGAVALGFEGAEQGLRVDRRGDLVARLANAEVRHRRPVAYQEGPGGREEVPARFVLRGTEVRFALGSYDRRRPLVIDPLVYSTYLGGSSYDYGWGIAVDRDGNAVVTGNTQSADFPTHNAVPGTGDGDTDDAFVAKLNATGSALVYSTYMSGGGADNGYDVAVDGSGNAYVGGQATMGFPTTPGAMRVCNATGPQQQDAFVAKFTPTGGLTYSTCLGGSGRDFGLSVAVDGSGNAHIAGWTESTDFPTANAFQSTIGNGSEVSGNDGFVAKLNTTGSGLVWSTYLGGSQRDIAGGIALDASGVYVAGVTYSSNFPTGGTPYQAALRGDGDIFVTKLATSGALTWSTYLGGTGRDGTPLRRAVGLAVDGGGRPYVASETFSTDFPTTVGALQRTNAGSSDLFVTKLNAAGSALVYSTYVGGSGKEGNDGRVSVAVDGSGSAFLAGYAVSTNMPLANALQSVSAGGDVYVAKLNPTGTGLVYGTYLGGAGSDGFQGAGAAIDPDGNAYLTGLTTSVNFPTAGTPYQSLIKGDTSDPTALGDAFVTKFDPLLGFLRITTNPALPSQITVDGVPRGTWGLINLEAAPGSHRVCFRDVEGFTKPACQDVNVTNGATTQVAGNFTQRGFLQVVTNPALPAKISVADVARDDWGIYTDLPVGTYRVCFGPVRDYAPPACQNATVTAGTTKTVTGNYTQSLGAPGEPAGNGALRVTTNPALPSQITVDGVPRATWGLINLQIAPGSHQVCFREVEGFVTPPCETVNVTAGATTVTQGNFVAKGFLQVVTSPALPSAIYVNSVPRDDWGIYTDYPVGTYEVCFGAVWGYRTPPCRTVSLTAGTTTTVTGTFTSG